MNRETQLATQTLDRNQARLQAAGIERGLEQQNIDAAFHKRFGLLIVVVAELLKSNRRGDVEIFRSRTQRSRDEARLPWSGQFVRCLSRQPGCGHVQLMGSILQVELG